MRKRFRSLDPYWLEARFASTCPCGQPIKRGDRIFYYPNGRKAVCHACGLKGQADLDAEKEYEALHWGNYQPGY